MQYIQFYGVAKVIKYGYGTDISDTATLTVGKTYIVCCGGTAHYINITYNGSTHEVTTYPSPTDTFVTFTATDTAFSIRSSQWAVMAGMHCNYFLIEL